MNKKEIIFTAQVFLNVLGQSDKFVREDYSVKLLEHDCNIPPNNELSKEVINYCAEYDLIDKLDTNHLRIQPIVLSLVKQGIDYFDEDEFDRYLKMNCHRWRINPKDNG